MSDRRIQQIDFTRTGANEINTVFMDVVGECNLRCVYCYQSDKDFKPHDGMKADVIESVIQFAKIFGSNSVNVTSTGEFTFGKDWQSVARRLLESGLAVCTTTNLAKLLDDDEVWTLSKFAMICLSLDSAERATLKSIRRSADIRTIAHNILRIKAAAIAEGRPITPFIVNCVLSTRNAATIKDLTAYCVMLGVNRLFVSPLHAFGDFGFDKQQLGEERVDDPLEVWDLARLKGLYEDLLKSTEIATRGNLPFGVSDAIVQRLSNKLNGIASNETLGPGMTRVCTQPWERVIVESNGDVRPCCYGADIVGNLSTQRFDQVVNGDKMVGLKTSLLTGVGLQPQCRNCVGEAIGTTDQLKAKVQDYFNARRPQARKAG
jgi:MoaA/NifB/PqqE/SkfB family radical SAM enzyme